MMKVKDAARAAEAILRLLQGADDGCSGCPMFVDCWERMVEQMERPDCAEPEEAPCPAA